MDLNLVEQKSLDKNSTVKVMKNSAEDRFFIEFFTNDRKIVLQKSFPDSVSGKEDFLDFYQSIKNTNELRKYFGLKKEGK